MACLHKEGIGKRIKGMLLPLGHFLTTHEPNQFNVFQFNFQFLDIEFEAQSNERNMAHVYTALRLFNTQYDLDL